MILSEKINRFGGELNKWIRLAKKMKKWKLTSPQVIRHGRIRELLQYLCHWQAPQFRIDIGMFCMKSNTCISLIWYPYNWSTLSHQRFLHLLSIALYSSLLPITGAYIWFFNYLKKNLSNSSLKQESYSKSYMSVSIFVFGPI